ncbi:MAG: ATP-dependent zinc metalloprotease FtsH [Candidatus Erwinia impunctatus]
MIIATNLKTNMDEASTRRFQSMVQFTIPGPQQRLQLWQNAFHGVCELAGDVNLPDIADRYEMAGGQIINVLRQCALMAIQRDERRVTQSDIITSIRKEFRK